MLAPGFHLRQTFSFNHLPVRVTVRQAHPARTFPEGCNCEHQVAGFRKAPSTKKMHATVITHSLGSSNCKTRRNACRSKLSLQNQGRGRTFVTDSTPLRCGAIAPPRAARHAGMATRDTLRAFVSYHILHAHRSGPGFSLHLERDTRTPTGTSKPQ